MKSCVQILCVALLFAVVVAQADQQSNNVDSRVVTSQDGGDKTPANQDQSADTKKDAPVTQTESTEAKKDTPATQTESTEAKKDVPAAQTESTEDKKDTPALKVDATCGTPLGKNETTAVPDTTNPNIYTGYLNVNPESSAALYYLYYPCRAANISDAPLVIWLQGGPGTSSLVGAFLENGPQSLTSDDAPKQTPRDHSWNDNFHMLYIDQPIGTGFSSGQAQEIPVNTQQTADQFLVALKNFYGLTAFNGLANTPLYIAGEDYTGKYIPAIAKAIIDSNNDNTTTSQIPLKGIAIGSAWVDPINQFTEYGLFSYALGLVDEDGRSTVEGLQLDAVYNIRQAKSAFTAGNFVDAQTFTQNAWNDRKQILETIITSGGNLYEFNYRQTIPNRGSIIKPITTYLNNQGKIDLCARGLRPDNSTSWSHTNQDVYNQFLSYDFMDSVADALSEVVESIPVLVYNGQDDVVCNSPSTQTWLSKLGWSGKQAFYDATPQTWILNNGTHAGTAKVSGNLNFVVVNRAGHLTTQDQVESTIEMMARFTQNNTNWANNTAVFTTTALEL